MDKRTAWLAGLIASGVSFIVTALTPQIISIWKHEDEISDSERDYVLRVIELQSKATAEQAQGIAVLTNAANETYLRDRLFRSRFSVAINSYALKVAGAAAVEQSKQADDSGEAPSSAGAAADLGRAQAASAIADASPAGTSAAIVQEALQPARGRVFFQVARPADRSVAQVLNRQLTSHPEFRLTPILGIEVISSFTGPTQLRYFFRNDRDVAQRLATALAGALPGLSCRYVAGYESSGRAKPQLFEVWLTPGVTRAGAVGNGSSVTC